jgi:hypothetical protein
MAGEAVVEPVDNASLLAELLDPDEGVTRTGGTVLESRADLDVVQVAFVLDLPPGRADLVRPALVVR